MTPCVYTADGEHFRFAPRFPDDIAPLPQSEREARGWYNLIAVEPEHDEAHCAEPVGYERVSEGYKRLYEIRERDDVVKYSTLSIKRELAALSKWETVKSLLGTAGVSDDYYLANYLSSADPVFSRALTGVVEAGILTQEELDELLPKCVWTAD